MKRIILILFFSFVFRTSCLWIPGLQVFTGHAETITLRADIWCPYNCEPDSDTPGFMVEIARHVFEKAGYSIDYQLLNWARAVEETRRGGYNGIIGAYREDAPDFIFPNNEQGRCVDTFYTVKGSSWHYEDLSSLSGMDIGIIMGYSYGAALDEYIRKNKIQFIVMHGDDTIERNLNMLFLGRTTALIENKFVMNHYISGHNACGRVVEAGIANVQNAYIAFSPVNARSKEYSEILSNGMDALRSSGGLQKILDRYGLTDWKQK